MGGQTRPTPGGRTIVPGGRPVAVAVAELVSSGAGVLVVCADASRRAALASGATGLARFNGGAARIACHRCGTEAIGGLCTRAGGGLALTDYLALDRAPSLTGDFEHVVLVDPPPTARAEELAARPREEWSESGSMADAVCPPGFLHSLWTEAEEEFALAVLAEQFPGRKAVADAYRALRDAGEVSGQELRDALAGSGPHPLCPEAAARRFRVLRELDLVRGEPCGGDGAVGVVSSEGTDLERSAAFRAYSEEHSEAQRYLKRRRQP